MKFNLNQLLSTLSQPSTYAGFAGLAAAGGVADSKYAAVSAALTAFFGIVAVVLNEKPTLNVTTDTASGKTVATVDAVIPVSTPVEGITNA